MRYEIEYDMIEEKLDYRLECRNKLSELLGCGLVIDHGAIFTVDANSYSHIFPSLGYLARLLNDDAYFILGGKVDNVVRGLVIIEKHPNSWSDIYRKIKPIKMISLVE